jgi:glutathione S-transferase
MRANTMSDPMVLIYQSHSPFARKVLVFAHEAGLAHRLHLQHQETSPTNRNDRVFAVNPLGKVPVLVLQDGEAIFDSGAICDHLDTLGTARLIPEQGHWRRAALRFQALAHGLCDAGVALRWETERRPEPLRYKPLADGMKMKLVETFDFVERFSDLDAPLHVGHIALATALAWLEFRGLPAFYDGRPKLTNWYKAFLRRSSMQQTGYAGETHD